MARYPSYQPTNIPWLPEIPTGWEMKRLRYCFSRVFSGLWGMEPTPNDDGIVCYRVADFDYAHGGISEDKLTYRAYRSDEIAGRLVEEGDLLLEKSGGGDNAPVGRVVIVDKKIKATCSNFIQALHCKEDYCSKFFCNVFRYMYSKKINGFYYNQTIGIQNLKVAEYLSIKIPLPPLSEQERIVAYLDKQTAKVDALIKAKTEQMALLKELRERTIADAVTRGLPGEHTSFQSTNIPWLPEIPVSWEVKRAKSLFKKEQRPIRAEDEIVTAFRDGQVTLRKNRRITGFTEATDYTHYQGIRKDDLVIHQMDAFAGCAGVSDSDGMGTPVLSVCTPLRESTVKVHYYAHVIRLMGHNGYIQSLARGIRERSSDFRFDTFSKQHLPVPPLSEQERIVAYLDKQTAKIDKAVALLASGIEHLKAYRERLIADVVTGQLKVE